VPREVAGRDLRGFEWNYLSRLCHSEARTLASPACHPRAAGGRSSLLTNLP
jgi:hypothetical protein